MSMAALLDGVLWSACKEFQVIDSLSGWYKHTQGAFAAPPTQSQRSRQFPLKMLVCNVQFQINSKTLSSEFFGE